MKIGDKVYSLKYNKILMLKRLSYGYYFIDSDDNEYFEQSTDRLLTLEQVADIFANKELEQLILNYKK